MSRNQNSRFALNPTNIDIQRSKFERSSSYKTTFNVGQLIPFYLDEVLPGDTMQIRTNKVVRMQPLVCAPFDSLWLDTYYFYVPNRLLWQHWKELNGENTQSAWIPQTEYETPQLVSPEGGFEVGTIADYFGIPTGVSGLSVNALPFRAYALIVNEWFRDQNLQQPLNIPVDDTTVVGSNEGNFVVDVAKGGKPFIANKYHDYFTSCLPAPQKGPDVTLGVVGNVPIRASSNEMFELGNPLRFGFYDATQGNNFSQQPYQNSLYWINRQPYPDRPQYSYENLKSGVLRRTNSQGEFEPVPASGGNNTYDLTMSNLYGDLGNISVATINQLRLAFQIQRLYEKDARGGTRYQEVILAHFGIRSPDARLQRPEYLGGCRVPININQCVQSSESANTPQGNIAGYSLTSDSHGDFIQSFTEHGFIIGLCVARYDHTYQQGLNRMWSRKGRFDYYWPVLANIGEQAVLNKEIYADGSSTDSEVFGYQEAWAEYRYKPSIVTGEMRSSYATSLDSWHFADDYEQLPRLSSSWIQEDKSNVDRVLAVQSNVSAQLFADFYIENDSTRPMPMYSIPGLIDHH